MLRLKVNEIVSLFRLQKIGFWNNKKRDNNFNI